MIERLLHTLQSILVCPRCKGKLDYSPNLIQCFSCNLKIFQQRDDCFDLLPPELLDNVGTQWEERQQEMESWYKDLVATPTAASDCFVNDYTPYIPLLATLSGKILDVGGGIGIVRNYLPRETQYTVVDPSLDWLRIEWISLSERFPCLRMKPTFVRGIGEYLPFSAQAFDAVLSFWSLNHVSDPELVFGEVWRVLRSGGRFVAVLEDMIPSRADIADGRFPTSKLTPADNNHYSKNSAHPSNQEWRLQSDHIRISESDILTWISQRFEVTRREWIGQYLTFEFRKTKSQQSNESEVP